MDFKGINWDEIAKGQLVTAGRHPTRIDKVEDREAQETGNEYLNIEFTIIEGADEGRKVWGIFMAEAQHLWKMRQLCDAIGIELSGRDDFDPYEELQGQEVGVVVKHDVYQGQERNRVTGFYNISSLEAKPDAE